MSFPPFEAYQGKEPYIFVSYAHKNKDVVYSDIRMLHKKGYRIWYDEGIKTAENWTREIAIALNNCSTFLVYISPESIKSEYVVKEIYFALSKKKKFIPIYLENTILPLELELDIGRIQAIMKFKLGGDYYFKKLIKALPLSIKRENQSIPEDIIAKTKENEKNEVEENARKEEDEKNTLKRVKKLVLYKGTQIPQFEAEILQELENESGRQFSLVNNVEGDTTTAFSVENQRITGIRLYKCDISILPESISYLKSLERLYLNNTKLKTLPESIGNLSSLQELWLNTNKIVALPKSISNLQSLEILYLGDNIISTLPKSIGNLSSLKTIYLRNNKLSTLPKSISNLKSLSRLNLELNKFIIFPKSILKLESLEKLVLENNKLKIIPKSIANLKWLNYLNLAKNQLTTLPESMIYLNSLKNLYLYDNLLDKKASRILQQLKENSVKVYK